MHEARTKDSGKYWLLFLLSCAASVAVYFFMPSITSLMLVPVCTSFAKALNLF
jgi:hypothetical protein